MAKSVFANNTSRFTENRQDMRDSQNPHSSMRIRGTFPHALEALLGGQRDMQDGKRQSSTPLWESRALQDRASAGSSIESASSWHLFTTAQPASDGRHRYKSDSVAKIQPGQTAWAQLDAEEHRGLWSRVTVASVQLQDDTITLATPSGGSVTVPLDDCIHFATRTDKVVKRRALSMLGSQGSVEDLLRGTDPPPAAVRGRSGRIYAGKALGCLMCHQQPRLLAIRAIEWSKFDALILCVIVANCATMAATSPLQPPYGDSEAKAAFIQACERFYLATFTVEMLTKIVALGLAVGNNTYLRDAWSRLDFVVVVLSWLPLLFPSFGNYSVIRSMRALRPLRALKRVPGMPELIESITSALPNLKEATSLCTVLFVVFAIAGVHLFSGAMHYRCAADGSTFCSVGAVDGGTCGPGGECVYFDHLIWYTTGFDNVADALLSVLKAFTFDTWTEDMYALMHVHSPLLAVSFFGLIVVIGGFFLVNVFLADLFQVGPIPSPSPSPSHPHPHPIPSQHLPG